MKVIKVKNYEELSRTAATIIAGVILSKPDCILGLATGSSPVGTYDQLAAMYEEGILDFSHVKSVNLDEYVGLDGSNDQSYRYFMNEHLFNAKPRTCSAESILILRIPMFRTEPIRTQRSAAKLTIHCLRI